MLPKSYVTNLRDFLSVCLNILHLTLFILILVLCLSLQPILNTSPILHLAFCLNFCFFKASALEKSKISWAYTKCIAHRNIQPPPKQYPLIFSAFYLNTRTACTFQCLSGFIKMLRWASFPPLELTTSRHRECVWLSQARSYILKI